LKKSNQSSKLNAPSRLKFACEINPIGKVLISGIAENANICLKDMRKLTKGFKSLPICTDECSIYFSGVVISKQDSNKRI
jgi:hypothetical protein